ncbi:hypothetical protein CEXT_198351 [Caerostris extrusa]|uniref:Uncharacterized protein n=1 Tax=Caerostris extrusa TaxID=172846 RepID=A0AAV4UEM8_CAEEX|nr:hypothetical protein CEXT_198351 [Caerostris extrusa]
MLHYKNKTAQGTKEVFCGHLPGDLPPGDGDAAGHPPVLRGVEPNEKEIKPKYSTGSPFFRAGCSYACVEQNFNSWTADAGENCLGYYSTTHPEQNGT